MDGIVSQREQLVYYGGYDYRENDSVDGVCFVRGVSGETRR